MKLKDFFNSQNIMNFLQGNYYLLKYRLNDSSIEKHVKEQALYRAELCKECLEEGKCLGCNCSTPGLFFAPNKEDHEGRWGKMLSFEKWEEFKKQNDISIHLDALLKDRFTFGAIDINTLKFKGINCFGKMNLSFLMKVDEALSEANVPFRIMNSYLDEEHNTFNLEKNTYHTQGRALDIILMSPLDLAKFVKSALDKGLSIQITPSYVHVDDRDPKNQIIYL